MTDKGETTENEFLLLHIEEIKTGASGLILEEI